MCIILEFYFFSKKKNRHYFRLETEIQGYPPLDIHNTIHVNQEIIMKKNFKQTSDGDKALMS